MINENLRDMINKGKMVAFVDDVLIGTETEERYDKIVEEVLRRLEENVLYVKPEKYTWKVQKVNFLGVVMCHELLNPSKAIFIFIFLFF